MTGKLPHEDSVGHPHLEVQGLDRSTNHWGIDNDDINSIKDDTREKLTGHDLREGRIHRSRGVVEN